MNNKLLASLTVFRELYNNSRDVYDVISKFIEEVIIHKSIYSFEVTEMKQYLDELFDFQLPEGIIKSSSKRLEYINIENKKFIIDKSKLNNSMHYNITNEEKNKSIYEEILSNLIDYIKNKENINIDEEIEKSIENEFSLFLLHGNTNNNYSNLISKFIVSNEVNEKFNRNINLIREGIILYTGLKYTPEIIELGSWKSKIIIYLDIEILFNAVGYNGKLYKNIFDDFYNLVKDINKQQSLISLKYFNETKNEIENFFTKAQYIVSGQDKLNSSIIAMNSIVKGCSSKADIVDKKIQFYNILKNYNILEETSIFEYNEENYKYNIISNILEQELQTKYNQNEIDYALTLLNNVSLKREEKSSNNFENIGAILLSANSKILKIANHDNVKEYGKVPLATNIDFLTNKFWFKLNKGFGTNDYPKTFSIFIKAQIILASHINENLNNQFSIIQEKIRDKTLTEDMARNSLSFFKENIKKPEDITSDKIDELYLLLKENSIEEIVNHHEYLKTEIEKQKKDKFILTEELEDKNTSVNRMNEEVKILHENLLNEKKERIIQLERMKKKLDLSVQNELRKFKIILSSGVLIYYITIIGFIIKYDWNTMEPIVYVFGLAPIIISFVYMIFFENKFSYKNFIENKKNNIQEKIYKENEFYKENIDKLKSEII